MNETYLYAIDSIVWTIDEDDNIAKSWKVKQVNIESTVEGNVITYIVYGNYGTSSYDEADLYPTLSDALLTL